MSDLRLTFTSHPDTGPPLILFADEPVIDRFAGEHQFLSNFAFSPIRWAGRKWRYVEHPFQAAKTVVAAEREAIYRAEAPAQAKRMGRTVTLRPDWEQVKCEVMADLVGRKFQSRDYAQLLLATGDAYLIEGNAHGDRTWGATRDPSINGTPWRGHNLLGRILMDVRRRLRVEWDVEVEEWDPVDRARLLAPDGGVHPWALLDDAGEVLVTEQSNGSGLSARTYRSRTGALQGRRAHGGRVVCRRCKVDHSSGRCPA